MRLSISMQCSVTGLIKKQKVMIKPQVVRGRCYPCLNWKYHLFEELKVKGVQRADVVSTSFSFIIDKVIKK